MGRRDRRGLVGVASAHGAIVTFILGAYWTYRVDAVIPTASLRLSTGEITYAAPAWFGIQPPEQEEASYLPLRIPTGDFDGCLDVSVDDPPSEGFVLLVERGHCFFDVKALAAQKAGALGLIVMNSVEGIYQVCREATELDPRILAIQLIYDSSKATWEIK